MRAAVTLGPNRLKVMSVAEPEAGANGVMVRPELVGVCGSDIHFFSGHLGAASEAHALYPRIQGHEFAGKVEAVGPGAAGRAEVGARVAVWPLWSCGHCYPCRIGRRSVCDNFRLIGIHENGALAELVRVPADQVFPIGDLPAALGAFVEPMAVAVHGVARSALRPGEQVVVLGGGPIGQAVGLAAKARGGCVLLAEPLLPRRQIAEALGAEVTVDPAGEDVAARVSEWTAGEGAAVVIDATGSPGCIALSVELVASAGRVVVVGISDRSVELPIGPFTAKEFDMIGSSCHEREDFEEAIRLVGASSELLAPRLGPEFDLDEARAALDFSRSHPAETMKVLVRVG